MHKACKSQSGPKLHIIHRNTPNVCSELEWIYFPIPAIALQVKCSTFTSIARLLCLREAQAVWGVLFRERGRGWWRRLWQCTLHPGARQRGPRTDGGQPRGNGSPELWGIECPLILTVCWCHTWPQQQHTWHCAHFCSVPSHYVTTHSHSQSSKPPRLGRLVILPVWRCRSNCVYNSWI